MKILLITDDFYPKLGGISQMLTNLWRLFKFELDTLYLFNPYWKSENIFNIIKKKYMY